MGSIVLVLGFTGGVLALTAGLMVRELVHEEYRHWAPALARVIQRFASKIFPSRSDEWWADLIALQKLDDESGVWLASTNFTGALRFRVYTAVRTAVARLRASGARTTTSADAPSEDNARARVHRGRLALHKVGARLQVVAAFLIPGLSRTTGRPGYVSGGRSSLGDVDGPG